MPEVAFSSQKSIFSPRRLFFFGFRFVFVVGEGPGGSRDSFSCSGMDFSYPGTDFSCPGLDFHARRRLVDAWGLVLFCVVLSRFNLT